MNFEELTNMGLTQEQAKAVLDAIKPQIDALSKLEAVSSELERAKATIVERDKQLDLLKDASAESKSLQRQIVHLQAQNVETEERYKKELSASRKAYAVRQALMESEQKPHNVKIVMDQLDLEKIFVDESGSITGLQEQHSKLLQEAPYLFKLENAQTGTRVQNGFSIHGAGATQTQQAASQSKPKVASADFGRQLAAVALKSQGITPKE